MHDLDPHRHADVKRVFQAALDLPIESRSAYLDSACAADRELREAVDGLLEAHDDVGSFLEGGALEKPADLPAMVDRAVSAAVGPAAKIARQAESQDPKAGIDAQTHTGLHTVAEEGTDVPTSPSPSPNLQRRERAASPKAAARHEGRRMPVRTSEAHSPPAGDHTRGGRNQELQTIGKYRDLVAVGQGAMGRVYRAYDPVLDRPVAIKTILTNRAMGSEEATIRRFQREARIAAKLNHPSIVTVYDFGQENDLFYLAMEFLEGTDLGKQLRRRKVATVDHKIQIMEKVCQGVAFAHENGTVHRDLKPSNIFCLPDGRIKILDFGLARFAASDRTTLGVAGTPQYMSPEQVRGEAVDARSDVFSLGAMFYEMLTAKRCFPAPTLHAILFQVLQRQPDSVRELDPHLPALADLVISKALTKETSLRFTHAGELLEGVRWLGKVMAGEAREEEAIHAMGLAHGLGHAESLVEGVGMPSGGAARAGSAPSTGRNRLPEVLPDGSIGSQTVTRPLGRRVFGLGGARAEESEPGPEAISESPAGAGSAPKSETEPDPPPTTSSAPALDPASGPAPTSPTAESPTAISPAVTPVPLAKVTYAHETDGPVVLEVDPTGGPNLLALAEEAGIPHYQECGGRGRCSTCRVRVLKGRGLLPRNKAEARLATRLGWDADIRLACQSSVVGDVEVQRLIHDAEDFGLLRYESRRSAPRETTLAVLSCRLMNSSEVLSRSAPYDIVHLLNRFYYEVGEPVIAAGGQISEYRDANLVAYFGLDGGTARDKCLDAARAALRVLGRVEDLNRYLQQHFDFIADVGVGLHFGRTIVGNLGHPSAMFVKALGEVDSVALWIAGLDRREGVSLLASEELVNVIEEDLELGEVIAERDVRGFDRPCWEILDFAKPDGILLVQTSFDAVAQRKDEAAELFYRLLFEIDTGARSLFTGVDMKSQGDKLMQVLAAAVQGLDKLDELVPIVQDLGRRHAGYGVQLRHYDSVEQALIEMLRQMLGPAFSVDMRLAWSKVYNTLAKIMIEASDELPTTK